MLALRAQSLSGFGRISPNSASLQKAPRFSLPSQKDFGHASHCITNYRHLHYSRSLFSGAAFSDIRLDYQRPRHRQPSFNNSSNSFIPRDSLPSKTPLYGSNRQTPFDNEWNGRLTEPNWSSSTLSPLTKNFHVEREEVAAKSEGEIATWRASHNMEIIGDNCPRPAFTFDHASFSPRVHSKLKSLFPGGPSPIQSQGWTLALTGRDMIASAQTGSGKTLAFLLPGLQHISGQAANNSNHAKGPSVLLLAPTRELAIQINQEAQKFTSCYGYNTACIYGGANNRMEQSRQLFRRPQICIATPGRLIDFVESNAIDISNVSYVVLDEADRMLDMGFEPQVRAIMGQIRPDRQTLMWSATWPKRVQQLADSFLNEPVRIRVGSDELSANKNVKQEWVFCSYGEILGRLVDLLNQHKDHKILIFIATKNDADQLADELYTQGHRVMSLHGDKPQSSRMRIMDAFKSGRARILIATDIAARGIDVSDVSLVINYHMPKNSEDYVHRIGRTGRAGRQGKSVSFFTNEDVDLVPQLIQVIRDSEQQVPEQFYVIQEDMKKLSLRKNVINPNRRRQSFSSPNHSQDRFGSGRRRN